MVERRINNKRAAAAFGGAEPYSSQEYQAEGGHYSLDPNHFERSLSAQPNHMNFLKRFLNTKPRTSDINWLLRRRLMRRIRRP